jgi:mRNA-degrading endonuclease YafQ of YafQ-DinJ toxin-antitoxin module
MKAKKTAKKKNQSPQARRIVQTTSFQRSWNALPPEVQRSVQHKVAYLATDPRHPSLHVHRLKRAPGMWVCYVSRSYRLLYRMAHHQLVLYEVGRHRLLDRLPRGHSR